VGGRPPPAGAPPRRVPPPHSPRRPPHPPRPPVPPHPVRLRGVRGGPPPAPRRQRPARPRQLPPPPRLDGEQQTQVRLAASARRPLRVLGLAHRAAHALNCPPGRRACRPARCTPPSPGPTSDPSGPRSPVASAFPA